MKSRALTNRAEDPRKDRVSTEKAESRGQVKEARRDSVYGNGGVDTVDGEGEGPEEWRRGDATS
jgi:hypothetical protein